MRARHRNAAAVVVALVLAGVGCGLSLSVDPGGPLEAGADVTSTSNPAVDGARPDGAAPDADLDADLGDVAFFPSNLDAEAGAYHLDGSTELSNVVRIVVSAAAAEFFSEAGAVSIPDSDIVHDPDCDCVVVSVKNWVVPAGMVVTITTERPLVIVASGEARIDGVVRVVSKSAPTAARGAGSQGGAAGGGAATTGGGGGAVPDLPAAGAAGSPRSDGGAALSPVKLPANGMNGGAAFVTTGPMPGCGFGGLGAGGLQVFARDLRVSATGVVSASGDPGRQGCAQGGGGGGGSGGTVFLEGRRLRLEGAVYAIGGGGGGGGSSDANITDAGPGASGLEGGAGGRAAPPCDGNGGSGLSGGPGADASAGQCGGGGGGGAPGFVRFRGVEVTNTAKAAPSAVVLLP